MARLSQVRRAQRGMEMAQNANASSHTRIPEEDAVTLMLASFMSLCDTFLINKRSDTDIKIVASLNIFVKEFNGCGIVLAKSIGDWLCSLPKGVWDDKTER
jgi:hypothetical protein